MSGWPRLEFGIPIPQIFPGGAPDMALVRRTLARAEELGFHSAWTQDQVAGYAPVLESVSLMSYAAAVTTRMKIGVSVIVFPIRNAVVLAKQVASLDQMSGGRVILGLGLGPVFADNYFRYFGTSRADAVRRFNEGLRVMKSLWTAVRTDFDGEFYQLANAGMEPKPVQKPHPPVWFGGQHPQALRRAARMADGYMGAGPTSNAEFGAHVRELRKFLDEERRDPASFPLSKRVYLALDRDENRAKRGLDEFFRARYPWQIERNPNYVADTCVWGGPARIVEGLSEVVRLGAGMIVLNPLWDFVEQIEGLAEDVIPALRSASPVT
jgi:probable F420-dependent oxidoreductase